MRFALTVVIGLLVFSGSASASTLSITMARPDQPDPSHAPGAYTTASSVKYTAAPGEANRLTVSGGRATLTLVDTGAILDAVPPGCTAIENGVECNPQGENGYFDLITIDLGDGDDHAAMGDVDAFVEGGDGDDNLHGLAATLVGGPGADVLDGRRVTYSGRTDPVTVTVDGVADDGAPGEGDNVIDAGDVIGGAGPDKISAAGVSHRVELSGRGGNDRLVGGSGNDNLFGEDGDDSLEGGPGNDWLSGAAGADDVHGGTGGDAVVFTNDRDGIHVTIDDRPDDGAPREGDNVHTDVEALHGTDGPDVLIGSAADNVISGGDLGPDVIDGGAGDDVIAAGSIKTITGGPGRDTLELHAGWGTVDVADGEADSVDCVSPSVVVHADAVDRVKRCDASDPYLLMRSTKYVRLAKAGNLRLSLRCADSACTGRLRLHYGGPHGAVIARAKVDLAPTSGGWQHVSLHVSKSGRARLAHDRKRTVVIDYFPAGGPLLTLGWFTLLRPH